MNETYDKFAFLQKIKPYVSDQRAMDKIRIDLNDLLEAGVWLSEEVHIRFKTGFSDWRDVEQFLIDLDIQYITHVKFHIESLKSELETALCNFPNDEDK